MEILVLGSCAHYHCRSANILGYEAWLSVGIDFWEFYYLTWVVWSWIVIYVGGHTAEMLNLLAALQKDRFYPRYYIAAATDNMSLQKARTFESSSDDEVTFPVGIFPTYQCCTLNFYRIRTASRDFIRSSCNCFDLWEYCTLSNLFPSMSLSGM